MQLESDFRPPRGLSNPHLQTLWAARARRLPRPALRRETWTTPDDDRLVVDWFGPASDTLLVLYHGLQGDSDSNYARALIAAAERRGLGGAVVHARGCAGGPNIRIVSYHCGFTADIDWSLRVIERRCPGARRVAIGYSIGGAALLNTLASADCDAAPDLAISVSAPLEPRLGATRMGRGFSRLYQHALVADCRRATRAKIAAGVPLPVDPQRLAQIRDFPAFDGLVTAALHGFAGAEDYYRRAAPRQRLGQISQPCHLIHSRDDPFFEAQMLPQAAELGPRTTLELSEHGGHVGFIGGHWRAPVDWLSGRLLQLALDGE